MSNKEKFYKHYTEWHSKNDLSAVTKTDDDDFLAVVGMGIDAIPYIKEVLDKKDDTIVYVLDEIFPEVVHVEGSVSFVEYCETWRKILKEI